MDNKQFQIIDKKLDSLIQLLSYNIVQGKIVQDQIKILDSVGLKPDEIAKIIGKTRNNVDQVLHKIRSKKNKKQSD